MAQKKTRVGIVGAGYVASYHLRALSTLEGVEVVGIAEPDLERGKALARQFEVERVVADLETLGESALDVVHVLTPPSTHCALTLQALDLGAHVLVEKPMAASVEECDRMIARARERSLHLSVNHSMLFDPMVLRALKWVREGRCGDVIGVDFIRGSEYPPYRGGPRPAPYLEPSYPFEDMGVHALYVMEAFLGQISDLRVRWRPSGRDPNLPLDEWRIFADCARGTGHAYLSWNVRPMPNELVVYGTTGVVRADFYLQTCLLARQRPLPKPLLASFIELTGSVSRFAQVAWSLARFATGRLKPSPSIHESVRAFHLALARGEAPPTAAEKGRRVVALVDEPARRAASTVEPVPAGPPSPGARILVTGAGGFLGGRLLHRLAGSGDPVRAFVRRPPAEPLPPNVTAVSGDLGDPEAVRRALDGIETVYHVGSAMRGGRADFERGTVWGTRNVVDAALAEGVGQVVHISSLGILDYSVLRDGATVDESAALEPRPNERGHYAWAKLEAERIVSDAVASRGLSAVILRPGQIVGPGSESVSPYGAIGLGGLWVVVGRGRLRLPLVHVEDVVDAMVAATGRHDLKGRVFHLVAPETVSQRAYLRALEPHLEGVRVLYVPRAFLSAAALLAEGVGALLRRPLPLTRYRLTAVRDLEFDCAAAARDLEWACRPTLPVPSP
jgi:predicted dehydrogenase/nucleoside-diphosphate-sugar epimerase